MLHVRSTGLLESKSCRLLADSPDAIAAALNEKGMIQVFAVEIKTMTALTTIQSASFKANIYGELILLSDVGGDLQSTQILHELVPTTQYRSQCLHHAATLCINSVLFMITTSGSMTKGRILYACIVNFTETIRYQCTYILESVRHTGFSWIGVTERISQKEYDGMQQPSHASDIHSFMSCYSLSEALRKRVENRNALIPPSRMTRLTPTVYYNHQKSGVDVISLYMKTLARCNNSENPVVSIIARLMSMQIGNAAVLHRLHCVRNRKQLPAIEDFANSRNIAYHNLRHRIAQSGKFGRFIRHFSREWVEKSSIISKHGTDHVERQIKSLTPMFSRNAAENYNIGVHKSSKAKLDTAA